MMENQHLSQQIMRNRSKNGLQEEGRSIGLAASMKLKHRDGLFVKRTIFNFMHSILLCIAILIVHACLHQYIDNLNPSTKNACNSTGIKDDPSYVRIHDPTQIIDTTDSVAPVLSDIISSTIENADKHVQESPEQELSLDNSSPVQQVVCVNGELYGRTFNQIMQLTAALAIVSDVQQQLQGLNVEVSLGIVSSEFNTFYEELFDPEADENGDIPIILHYDGKCDYTYSPRKLLYTFVRLNQSTILRHLRFPKVTYRAEAERILFSLREEQRRSKIITVHRRNLEGVCISQAQTKSRIVCPNYAHDLNESELVNICNMEYKMVVELLEKTGAANDNIVLLTTDHQVPPLDETFPLISNFTFPVEMWIMVLSDQHYGNPMSTIDLIVYYWRSKRLKKSSKVQQFPKACYQQPPGGYKKPTRIVSSTKLVLPEGSNVGGQLTGDKKLLPLHVVCVADDAIDPSTDSQFVFHYIMQLAVAFVYVDNVIGENDSKLGLGPNFSKFFETWFDDTSGDVLLYHFNKNTSRNEWNNPRNCYEYYQPWDLFQLYFEGYSQDAQPFLTSHLLPKASYREEARKEIMALQNDGSKSSLVTVHRDTIEHKCIDQAEKLHHIQCPNNNVLNDLEIQDFLRICNMTSSTVLSQLVQLKLPGNENPNILLFTDYENPVLDETFSRRILFRNPKEDFPSLTVKTQKLPLSVWMMILSDVHFGNPLSFFDLVLHYWRKSLSVTNNEAIVHSEALYQEQRSKSDKSLERLMMPIGCYSKTNAVGT